MAMPEIPIIEQNLQEEALRARGIGFGRFLPRWTVSAADFAERLNRAGARRSHGEPYTAEGVRDSTGVENRHYLFPIDKTPDQNDAELPRLKAVIGMAKKAVREALANKGWLPSDVDALLFTTSAPLIHGDQIGPSPSKLLKAAMNMRPWVKGRDGDVWDECSSLGTTLKHVWENSQYRDAKVVYVTSEVNSSWGAPGNKHRGLFSDGAVAAAFIPGEDFEVIAADTQEFPGTVGYFEGPSQPSLTDQEAIISFAEAKPSTNEKGYGDMNGKAVFAWALRHLPDLMENVRKQTRESGLRVLFVHQAVGKMTQFIKGLMPDRGLGDVYVPENIRIHGNIGSATVPNLLLEVFQNGWEANGQRLYLQKGDVISIFVFGLGMKAAQVALRLLK